MWRRRSQFDDMSKQNEFLEEIKQMVLSFDDKAEVILYGSRARGDYREDSDWDLLIVTSFMLSESLKDALRTAVYNIELTYLQDISTIIVDRDYWEYWEILPLFKNVVREGIAV